MQVVLINLYELGRQPFGLSEPAAWLKSAGFNIDCVDLSIQRMDPDVFCAAKLVAIYVPMHTATRIAIKVIPRIQALAPTAHLCAYGLYAPMNSELLRGKGIGTIIGGEFEPALVDLACSLRSDGEEIEFHSTINLNRIDFIKPDRSLLPSVEQYAKLVLPNGSSQVMGFAEGSRGCKHFCRHCPIVPVYKGTFRVVPVKVILDDIRGQVEDGAKHISFGDPDFLNGPTHARRLVEAVHREFPQLTYDVTIKIQHLLQLKDILPLLKATGCLFITSAVEAVEEDILEYLAKGHTNADFGTAVELIRDVGIAMAPTFVAFTPWTSLQGYLNLLKRLVELRLVESVPPIQLAIRLLIPEGSYLLKVKGFLDMIANFDPEILGYPWQNADPRVDDLQAKIQDLVEQSAQGDWTRRMIFQRIWDIAHDSLEIEAPSLPKDLGEPIPHHSEAWYCCAEPTDEQLMSF